VAEKGVINLPFLGRRLKRKERLRRKNTTANCVYKIIVVVVVDTTT